ncbi:DNA-binding response regulator [Treponema pedis str. T A4]|uniref:DNA-binding response regulator n=2 Tax=Treponema pedis TaxID=409322 RepID=S5ZXW7_9SPIR|nr:response regulator transcription factor [Treponema pedis]AGT42818.1 DNA-binding response regulator [Treponema pedis str. T A4]
MLKSELMRIVIVDDEELIREGLKIIFSGYPEIEVAGTGADGNEAVELCKKYNPDLVLMDIRMPHLNGIEAVKKIKEYNSGIKILILTTFNDSEYIRQGLKNGASGYLLKDSSPDVIYDGIKAAISGNVVINPEVAQNIFIPDGVKRSDSPCDTAFIMNKYNLSRKEIEIIKLVAEGLSNKEIAYKQHLSEGTIKNNISAIFSKTFVTDRTQLAAFAFKNNIDNA